MVRLALAAGLAQVGFHAFIASLPIALLDAGRANAEIGAIVGTAALVPIVAALVAGGLIDRYGPRRVFYAGLAAFFTAGALIATGVAAPDGPTAVLVFARVLQGVGLAFVMPSGLALVPLLVRPERLGLALGVAGMGANISLALSPPASLVILDLYSIRGVAVAAMLALACSALILWPVRPERSADVEAVQKREQGGLRTFRPTWRSVWLAPLLVSFLYVAHWGVATAYLPQRAAAMGADVGLFFTADALGVLLLRVPAGWLAGRWGTRPLILGGLLVTIGALVLLIPPPSTLLLILSGLGTGGGAALILPPITLELSNRSSETDRGSAFALFNFAFSCGIAAGSIGIAPFIDALGFELAISLGIGAILAASVVQLFDHSDAPLTLQRRPAQPS